MPMTGSKHDPHERVIAILTAEAPSMLRIARRHSLCPDDAQDAYQRAVEIFLRRTNDLRPETTPGWLRTVVKHEAMAVRRARQQQVAGDDIDFEAHEAADVPTAEERLLSFDQLTRSAEALQRLKAHEVSALLLKAEGYSYAEISEMTGWTYTKVNRCITEGRRNFLRLYAGIEAGLECERWAPLLSAIADGEASAREMLEARPHLRGCPACRASIRAARESGPRIAAVLPLGALALSPGHGLGDGPGFLVRAYEAISCALHDRAAVVAVKVQAGADLAASGKVAAVAASAAAVAGGGAAVVERVPPAKSDRSAEASTRDRDRADRHATARAPDVVRVVTPSGASATVRSGATSKPKAAASREVERPQPRRRRASSEREQAPSSEFALEGSGTATTATASSARASSTASGSAPASGGGSVATSSGSASGSGSAASTDAAPEFGP